jgi:hypothetical protein
VQGQATQVIKNERPAEPQQIAALASLSPVQPPTAPDQVVRPDSELSEPEQVLKATYLMWATHFEAWKGCLGGKDPKTGAAVQRDDGLALAHAAACVKLRESYDKALAKFNQWEVEQRRLIPVNEFAAMRAEFIVPLGNLLANLPAELAVTVNPKDPQFALAALSDYLQARLQPAIQRLIANLDLYVAAA